MDGSLACDGAPDRADPAPSADDRGRFEPPGPSRLDHGHPACLSAEPAARPAQVRLLTFTTLFPHAGRPNHGIFVENRLRHLVATGEATSTVLAPVPWFPSRS